MLAYPSLQYGRYFRTIYNGLPSHSMIYFQISFTLISSWDPNSDHFGVNFDSKEFIGSTTINSTYLRTQRYCGYSGYGNSNVLMNGKFLHAESSVTLKIVSFLNTDSDDESFGFRDILLYFVTNPPNTTEYACHPYNAYTSLATLSSYCPCPQGQYWNPSTNQCVSCHYLCQNCFGPGPNQCIACNTSAMFNGVECIDCGVKAIPLYVNDLCIHPCSTSAIMIDFVPDTDRVCKGRKCFFSLLIFFRMSVNSGRLCKSSEHWPSVPDDLIPCHM